MRIFFSVGEPSGDLHGANLVGELKRRNPATECVGFGGPKMSVAGCNLLFDLTQLAVMGITGVLLLIPKFWSIYLRAGKYFKQNKVDALVMIDYPGFNWWMAGLAKKHGIPVFYYGTPQMWAWGGWRIKKMRRLIDHTLCKLPFEAPWYEARGCKATYVGHPYYDELAGRKLNAEFLAQQQQKPGRLIAILPGSRRQEVKRNLPWFLKTAALIAKQHPDVRFAIASFSDSQAAFAREQIADLGLPIEVHQGRTPELIQSAECCLACSGSVSLELLYHTKPTVILYYMPWLAITLAAKLCAFRVKYITLVNMLADENPFSENPHVWDPDEVETQWIPYPEYPTCEDRSERLAGHINDWLADPVELSRRVQELQELKQRYAQPGASCRAAEYILQELGSSRTKAAA